MQSLHSHLWKNDQLKFEATSKLLKLINEGIKIWSRGFSNLPKLINILQFIVGFRVDTWLQAKTPAFHLWEHRWQDFPFEKRHFGHAFCTPCITNAPKNALSSHMWTLILKIFLWAPPCWAHWLDTRYERMPNALKVFGNHACIKPLHHMSSSPTLHITSW